MSNSISGKRFESSGSTVLLQGSKFSLQFMTTLFLVRSYRPEDYGKLAVVLLVLATIDLIRDFGLSDLQLSRVQNSHTDKSMIFRVITLNGIVASIVLVTVAILCKLTVASEFYFNAFLIVSLIPALNGISNFIRIDLLKEKRNARCWIADLCATLLTSFITLMILNFQPNQFLLQFQLLINASLISIFLAISKGRVISEYRLGEIDWNVYRESSNFGFNRIVKFAGQNMDTLLVGTILGTSILGLYNKAFQLIFAPLQQTSDSVGNLAISRSLADSHNLKQVIGRVSKYHHQYMLIIVPPLLFLAVYPRQVISLLFGPNWLSMASLIPFLSISGVFYLNLMLINWVLVSTQQSIQLLRMNLLINSLLVIFFLLFAQMGVRAICLSILCIYFSTNVFIGFAQSLKGQGNLFFYFRSLSVTIVKSILSLIFADSFWDFLQFEWSTFSIALKFCLFMSSFLVISIFAGKWNIPFDKDRLKRN